jgi:hypothetical protein
MRNNTVLNKTTFTRPLLVVRLMMKPALYYAAGLVAIKEKERF